jgi:drug/metabolite transporter (DMT)-like permease
MESQSIKENIVSLVTNKLWLLGFALSASAVSLNWLALGMAEMSAIQPLIGFGLIVLVIAAHFLLGERISRTELLGIALALGGVVTVGFGAHPGHPPVSLATLAPTYAHPSALVVLGALGVFLPLSWLVCRAFAYRGASLVFAVQTAVATILGLTFSKGFFGVLATSGPRAILSSPLSIFFAFLFVFFSFLALFLQQFALQKGRSVVVVPIINVLQIALPLVTGLCVFQETLQPAQLWGVGVLLLGVIALGLGKTKLAN